MMELSSISATMPNVQLVPITKLGFGSPVIASGSPAASFQSMLTSGLDGINTKITKANDLVRQFAVNDDIPVHQVTIALEEARLSIEMAMQVRMRMLEGYRELMNMQL